MKTMSACHFEISQIFPIFNLPAGRQVLNLKCSPMPNVDLARVPDFYHKYINRVQEQEILPALEQHTSSSYSFLASIPEEKWNYRYAEGKWSIKELVQHLIDCERIFAYRALTFARKDETPLPGFEENDYAKYSEADRRSKSDLLGEWQLVNRSSQKLFESFTYHQLEAQGHANGNSIYVTAIGFILCGHAIHHIEVLKERYLN